MAVAATSPLLSVVLVSFNSRRDLEGCIPSLASDSLPLEIIVVDNASVDGTDSWLAREHPSIHVVALRDNRGYAGGNNAGIRVARGLYILVLNPDTVVHAGALKGMVCVASDHPDAFITPKFLQLDSTVNTCGNQMHLTGLSTCVGHGEPAAKFHGVFPVALLSGAGILATREAWTDVGGFDESFFLYMEDADLSLRARLKGYTLLCVADAEVTHDYRLGMRPEKFGLLERNRLLTIYRNFEGCTLCRMVPALLLTELFTWCFAALHGQQYISARFRGYLWLWRNRQKARAARAVIQTTRVVSDDALLPYLDDALPLGQLVTHPVLLHALQRLTTTLYRRIRLTTAT